jgi:site-specific DNA-cytosine methylase
MYRAIDCLGFAGGFTLGVVQSGFKLVGKRELTGGFGVANCEVNRHLLGDSWEAEACDPVRWTVPGGGAELVFGNPPCSGFSVMSAKEFRGADSKINHCMWAFVDYVARVRPLVAVFESVQQARTRSDGIELMRRLRTRLEEATGFTWDLHHVRHNAYHLGGPSQRRRYFWVVSRVPFGVEPTVPERYPVLNEVIGDLGGLALTWDSQAYRHPPTWWSKTRRGDAGVVDGHAGATSPLIGRVFDLAREVGWAPGECISDVCRRAYATNGRLPASFHATEAKLVASDFRMGFTTPVRWRGDRPGRVITGGSLVMVLHPTEDRMITHREAARLLGFPDDWLAAPLRGLSGLQMTWGKGITVDCGRWVADWVHRALDENPGSYRGVLIGDREWDIDITHGLPAVTPGRVGLNRSQTTRRAMSEQNVALAPVDPAAEATNEAPTSEGTGGRGRGRPDETVKRDEYALTALTQAGAVGLTRDELAAKITELSGTETSSSEAYLCVYRLNRDGKLAKVQHSGKPHWVIAENREDAEKHAAELAERATAEKQAAAEQRAAEKAAEKAAVPTEPATTATEAPVAPVDDDVA